MPVLPYRAVVLTVSDSASTGKREDTSGPAVKDVLTAEGYQVVRGDVVPDDVQTIAKALLRLVAAADLIVTTGGTGLGPRDITPEATCTVCERMVPGMAEVMRSDGIKATPFAALSRGVCGARGKTLIVNLPGSPAGAVESLRSILHLIPHALELLRGKTDHPR